MIPLFVDYATPSVFESTRDSATLGLSANARRPVRFHGRVVKEIPLLRFTLRALGEAIWSDDTWSDEGEFKSFLLDPVVTVHPDRIFFEAFSGDQSVYAMVVADPVLFAMEGPLQTGTTNVDFTAWLWAALNEMRSSRETWLRVEAGGLEVTTKGSGGRFEQKVELPDSWVRGFLQISGAMAMPGTRFTVKPADLLAAIRFMRYTKARVSPRALRYEFTPGEEVKLILEPWEEVVTLRGAEHNYSQPHTIRTWGRRRLKLIEPLLPFADQVDIYLKGRSLPSFYAVKMPGLTFVLGLSGWTAQTWTDSGSFDLLSSSTKAEDPQVTAQALEHLKANVSASPKALTNVLRVSPEAAWRACERLARQGRVIYDVESRAFRHRELFEKPIDEAKLFPPDQRLEKVDALLASGAVQVAQCLPVENRKTKNLKTPEGRITREIIYREWRAEGSAGEQPKVEIVINDLGRIIFGVCGCQFFRDHILNKGPCEHMIALYRKSEPLRGDLASSAPADPELLKAERELRAQTQGDKEVDGADADEDS